MHAVQAQSQDYAWLDLAPHMVDGMAWGEKLILPMVVVCAHTPDVYHKPQVDCRALKCRSTHVDTREIPALAGLFPVMRNDSCQQDTEQSGGSDAVVGIPKALLGLV